MLATSKKRSDIHRPLRKEEPRRIRKQIADIFVLLQDSIYATFSPRNYNGTRQHSHEIPGGAAFCEQHHVDFVGSHGDAPTVVTKEQEILIETKRLYDYRGLGNKPIHYSYKPSFTNPHRRSPTYQLQSVATCLLFAIAISSTLTLTFVKISALDLFVSIFPVRKFRIAVYTVMAITTCYGLSYTVATLASCQPIQFNWDKTIASGTCIDTSKYYTSQTIISLLLDVMVVGLPMPMLWGLKMQVQRRIALMCIFGMGIFICIISILRAVLNATSLLSTDFPLYIAESSLLGLLEANFSIINACLPLLQPVATVISHKLKSLSSGFGSRGTTLKNQGALSMSTRKSTRKTPFGGSEDAKFKRLQDHLYPLSYDSVTQVTNTGIEATCGASNEELELRELDSIAKGESKRNQRITVTNAWKVDSDSVG
ncbi:hypothetical protein G7Y89_g8852 [Cudoniella acicularis]|uniref:Rhodopsin domain-containing protein n=1 Tax=Cudoniella acicularis TaxID=354080 RepID=A0A8H4RJJ3_9HELO|nr:hypothetical protein G7Y89_g8852 [Cudoniella acicularis]